MENKASILGGKVVKGSIVYEVVGKGVVTRRVLDVPVSDWSTEVFDVALNDGYTRSGGARRALCKTYAIAEKYSSLLEGKADKPEELQDFFKFHANDDVRS